MKKYGVYFLLGGGALFLVFLGFFLLNKKDGGSSSQQEILNKTVLFYGDTCPHCLIVNEYLEKNKFKEKFSFEHLEVYGNKDNAALLAESAKKCGIESNQIGVPLLWNEGKCLVGDKEIIDFFKEKGEELK